MRLVDVLLVSPLAAVLGILAAGCANPNEGFRPPVTAATHADAPEQAEGDLTFAKDVSSPVPLPASALRSYPLDRLSQLQTSREARKMESNSSIAEDYNHAVLEDRMKGTLLRKPVLTPRPEAEGEREGEDLRLLGLGLGEGGTSNFDLEEEEVDEMEEEEEK